MKAVILNEFGGRDVLKVADVPKPEPGPGEVRIEVVAAGVNPVDWKIREGYLKDRLPNQFPIILGWDVAGRIDAVGTDVSAWQVGDEVYSYVRKPVIQHGAYAEYVTFDAAHIARKPESFSFEEAASVPLAALTAYQSLFDAGNLQPGERVLIHAAAGGVGGFAVQLARVTGAMVWGTASEANHVYLNELGADHVVDYHAVGVWDQLKESVPDGMDLIYDCIGGDTFDQSIPLLSTQGRIVSILEPDRCQSLMEQGTAAFYVFVEPNGEQLAKLTALADSGSIKTHLAAVLPLEDAARAHELIESLHTRGKIVLKVRD